MMMTDRMFPMAVFNDFRREMDRVLGAFSPGNGRPFREGLYPPVNVWEDGEAFYLEAEIPGVDMKDIDLEVVGNELTIKGRREPVAGSEGERPTFHRRERGVGEFSRVVMLPTDVNPDKVEATLRDGVLTITLPKAERVKARKITVKTN
jgi:HSP20 family protein